MSIKLIIADDAPFIREVVKHLLAANNMELLGEADNGERAVEMALRRYRISLERGDD